MFTRVLEARTKTGKTRQFTTAFRQKILPILRKESGFIAEITLVSTSDPERVLVLSFWQTEADATRFNVEQYPTTAEALRPILESIPRMETFEVDTSTYKIDEGKVA